MTAYCEMAPPVSAFERKVAVSDIAEMIQRQLNESIEHYFAPRFETLRSEIDAAVEESRASAAPVDEATAQTAFALGARLPRSIPLPEVSFDPDGEMSFDWFGPSKKLFSVSINRSGRLSYAGWFREDSRVHGTEKLDHGFPEEMLRALRRTLR